LPTGHHIAIAFDDAFANLLEHAFPLLQQHNIPSTLFVPTAYFDTTAGWLKNSQHPTRDMRIMSAAEISQLSEQHIHIGSHSVSHCDLRKATPEALRQELYNSKQTLEKLCQQPITTIAYPYGYYNDAVLSESKKAGYTRVFTAEHTLDSTDFLFDRIPTYPEDSLLVLRLKVLGAYAWQPTLEEWIEKVKGILGRK
jgi:peptidoglycan/xylan/chitin deacetylase (PgdA/CDA1 family)